MLYKLFIVSNRSLIEHVQKDRKIKRKKKIEIERDSKPFKYLQTILFHTISL